MPPAGGGRAASRLSGDIKIYPGAYHSFDSYNPVRYVATRVNPNTPSGRGATTGGDPAAWADRIREVGAFLRPLSPLAPDR
jgi:acetyl esterase/lipase